LLSGSNLWDKDYIYFLRKVCITLCNPNKFISLPEFLKFKRMKFTKSLFAVLIFAGLSVVTSCSSDDYEPDPPVINFPTTGIPDVISVGETINFEFIVDAPRGYSSHFLTWSAGFVNENSVAIPEGETRFSISGQFTAGDIPGLGRISLAVTDREGNSDLATIEFLVRED
jgi:hypothetical protein